MAVHNGARYLRQAIDSILGQTFVGFEFIIINDGSTDGTSNIISSYGDPRIQLITNSRNLGLTKSLNIGFDAACGEYIARIDSDDVSLPERLEKQVAYMDRHPDIAASGTWAKDIDQEGNIKFLRHVPVGKRMAYDFWRPSPLIHPSAIIRVAHLKGRRYNSEIRYGQDYDLWLSLRKEYKIDNLPEYLLLYRVHAESITRSKWAEQLKSTYEVFCRQTGFAISYEVFLELIGFSRKLNPVQRALLTRGLARALGTPYFRYVRADISYAWNWLAPRLTLKALKFRSMNIAYNLWLRIRPGTTSGSLKDKTQSRLP
jgi:glycosyltransferase involved in cell wall biosynthesis